MPRSMAADDNELAARSGTGLPPSGYASRMAREEYRSNAMECMRMADQVTHPAMRASLLQMAQKWLQLYEKSVSNAEVEPSSPPPAQTIVPQQQQMQQQQLEPTEPDESEDKK